MPDDQTLYDDENNDDLGLERIIQHGITADDARAIIRAEMRKISKELAPSYGTLDGNSDLLDVTNSSNPPVTADDEREAQAFSDDLGETLRQIAELPPSQQESAMVYVFGSVEEFEAKFIHWQEMNDPQVRKQLQREEAAQARRASDAQEIATIRAGKNNSALRADRQPYEEV